MTRLALATVAASAAVAGAAPADPRFAPQVRTEPAGLFALDEADAPLRVRLVGAAGRAESWSGVQARFELPRGQALRVRRERGVSLRDGTQWRETSVAWTIPLAGQWQASVRASGGAASRDRALDLGLTLRF